MSNLVELANELEDFPKEQLIQMSQDPNSTYPSYLVLSEIKRRTQMEKMYAAQQPKPETTVSDELVAEFAGSPSGLGAMAQSSDTPNAFQSGEMGNMAPPSPLMTAASGGLTGYQAGGDTALAETFNNPMTKTKFQSAGEMILDAGSNVVQWAKNNPVDAAIIGVSFVPGVGWLAGAGLRSISAARKAMKGKNIFKSMYSKSKPIDVKSTKTPDLPGIKGKKLDAAKDLGYGSGLSAFGKITPDRVFSPKRYYGTLGTTYGIKQLYDYGMSPAEIQENETDPATTQTQNEDSKGKVNEDVNTGNVNANKGLRERFKDFATSPDNADMLIALGSAIGSARSPAELSSGIGQAYRGVMADRTAKEAKGLEGQYIQAQIANIEANIAGMPLKELQSSAAVIQEGLESGALNLEEYAPVLKAIADRITLLQNLAATGLPDEDVYKKTGTSIT
jgi:hypothetical protein